MAFSLNNSNSFFSIATSVSGYPFSMVGWFRVPDVNTLTNLMGIVDFSTGASCEVYFAGDSGKQAIAKTTNGSSGSASSTSPMIPGQWHHLSAVFASDTERKIYLDGGNVGVNTTNIPIGVLSFYYFGNIFSTDSIEVADVSIIETALDEEQVVVLAKGFSVRTLPSVRDALAYQDCIRHANRPGLGPGLSMAGLSTVVEHPRMMFPIGGYSMAMTDRVRGPFRVEEMQYRSLSNEQGQLSSAGVVSTNAVLSGEVIS